MGFFKINKMEALSGRNCGKNSNFCSENRVRAMTDNKFMLFLVDFNAWVVRIKSVGCA